MDGSKAFALNATDWAKVFTGLIVAVLGAALTWGTEQLPNIDLGNWTPIVVAAWSVVANLGRKWITDHTA